MMRQTRNEGRTGRLNESTGKSTDHERLPQVVFRGGDHELVELTARVSHRQSVVNDVVVNRVSGQEFAEVETVGLFQELCSP